MKLWIMIGWLLTIAVAVAGIVGKERVISRGDGFICGWRRSIHGR
jgi:hypothetical protein